MDEHDILSQEKPACLFIKCLENAKQCFDDFRPRPVCVIHDKVVVPNLLRLAREIQAQLSCPERAIALMIKATKPHCFLLSVCFFQLNKTQLRLKMNVLAS